MKIKKGFTLVEVMIVVAIIGLLAAIGIPSIMNAMSKAQEKAKDRNIASVEKAKAMLQLPTAIHDNGLGLAVDAVVTVDPDLLKCMQGVEDITDLDVDGTSITVGVIGTTASYDVATP